MTIRLQFVLTSYALDDDMDDELDEDEDFDEDDDVDGDDDEEEDDDEEPETWQVGGITHSR
jgi:hypothetical protein